MGTHSRRTSRRQLTAATASAATVVVLGGLWFGTNTADAADPPAPGSEECTALVEADARVEAAVADETVTGDALVALRLQVQAELCTGVVVTEPEPTSPTTTMPTTPTAPPTNPTPSPTLPPLAAGGERDCSSFPDRAAAQAFYDKTTTPADRDPYGLDTDGNGRPCEEYFTDASAGTGALDPRADDGSVPELGGSQVIEVPQGSVDTGAP